MCVCICILYVYVQYICTVYIYIHKYICIYAAFPNGKGKTEARVIILNLYCAKGSLSFVHLLAKKKKRKLSFCKWTKRTCPSMGISSV